MKKRILSLLIVLALCLSLLPTMALAGSAKTYLATEKTISKNKDDKCTVTLEYTDDAQDTEIIWHFTLNSDSYESGRTYSDFTAETASIEGTGKDEPFHSASITITDVDNTPVMIGASIRTGDNGNVDYKVQWTLDQTHDGITFKPWLDTTSLPTKAGDYYLLGDVTLTDTWSPKAGSEGNPAITNLCLNGHVIKMNGSGSVIKVPADATLNLYDCNEGEHVYKFVDQTWGYGYTYWKYAGEVEPGIYELKDGEHIIRGGCITGGTGTDKDENGHLYGGGVFVAAGGKFVFNGGNIVGNSAVYFDGEHDPKGKGGGVYVEYNLDAESTDKMGTFAIPENCAEAAICGNLTVDGGGVADSGRFTMDSGRIEYNMAMTSGGGIYASKPFTMTDGMICNNTSCDGGGVSAKGTAFTMTGGSISDNTAYSWGGGVYSEGDAASFTMTGGSISDNTAAYFDGEEMNGAGGGVYSFGGAVTVTGGSITGNIAALNFGGVYVDTDTTVTLGGTAQITGNYKAADYGEDTETLTENNLYLPEDLTITLGTKTSESEGNGAAKPADGMLIGVTTKTAPTADAPVVIVTSGAAYGDDDRFFSDAGYSMSRSGGELQIVGSYAVKVGGTQVTPANKDDVLGDADGNAKSVSYDPATKTLTLNNAKIATDGTSCSSAINSSLHGDLTIKLVGENQIGKTPANVTEKSNYKVLWGIGASDNNVTITGSGSLTMYTQIDGIWADNVDISPDFTGTLTIKNYGEINTAGDKYISDMPGIRAGSGVAVRGGTLNITCHDGGGIYAGEGNIVIEGKATKVNVTSDNFSGIKAAPGTMGTDEVIGSYYAGGGNVRIYDGAKVTVSAGTKVDELITDVYGIYAAGGVKIGVEDEEKAPEVTVTAGNANVSIGKGDEYCEVCGIMSQNRDTTIYDAKVSVTNAKGHGIYAYGEFRPEIDPETGAVVMDPFTGEPFTIYFAHGDIYILAGAEVSVTVCAESDGEGFDDNLRGIFAQKDVTIKDSKVDVKAGNASWAAPYATVGVRCDSGNITIDGSKVTATVAGSSGGYGLQGSVVITGGTVKAKGTYAIYGIGFNTPALIVGSEEAPIAIHNAQVLTAASPLTFEAITEGKGRLDIENPMGFYGILKAASDSVDDGYVTIGEVEQPAPVYYGGGDSTVTVPVAGDKDSVKVQASVSGSDATIKNVTAEQLEKIGTGKEVTVDLSSLNKSVTGVTFPKTTLENVAASEASGLEVKLPGGTTAVFDKATVAAIAEQAEGNDIQLVIDTTVKAAQVLTGAQKSAIKGMKSALVLEAYFTSNGKRISDFKGGSAELTVSYPTTKPVRVWYLTEAGALEAVPSSFDGKSASFVVKHFSNYVIEQLDETVMPFVDVAENTYYYDAVLWAAENGITKGTDVVHFSPDMGTTRAQVVTFLWRAAGCPEAEHTAAVFKDVSPDAYYVKAVEWALSEGITKGTSNTTFSPDAVCTRGQIVTFLARFAGVEDADTTSAFADVKSTDYFAAAVKWAKDNGVTEGTSATTFSPNDDCTRAQVVTFLYRWMVK